MPYLRDVPKLWESTIDAHRRAVRDAVLDAAAALVQQHGLGGVTMSRVAQDAGVGRATLYKYFPDVESILEAWHERQVSTHLAELREVASTAGVDARARLRGVLTAYAFMTSHQDGSGLSASLHRSDQVTDARRELAGFVASLLSEAALAGVVRDDVKPDELAMFCLHALSAASELGSKAAVHRLVEFTLDGVQPRA